MVGAGTNLLSPSLPSTYKSLSILATLQSYIFARLRRITFSFGNVTAAEIKIKLLLVLDMCQRYRKKYLLPLLLWRYWDDCLHKKIIKWNKTRANKSLAHFFTVMNPQIQVISSPVKPCSFLPLACKPWDQDIPSYTSILKGFKGGV